VVTGFLSCPAAANGSIIRNIAEALLMEIEEPRTSTVVGLASSPSALVALIVPLVEAGLLSGTRE